MAAPLGIRGVPDEELIVRARRNAFEDWLRRSTYLVGVGAGIAAVAVVLALELAGVFAWGWCRLTYVSLLAFLAAASGSATLSIRASRFRCRHALRELERRYGCLPLRHYSRLLRRTIGPDEIAVVAIVHAPLSGRHSWTCVYIAPGGAAASVEIRHQTADLPDGYVDFGTGILPRESFRLAKAPLPSETAVHFMGLLTKIRPGRFRVPATVKDGLPVVCAVIRGNTRRTSTIRCNLAGLPAVYADRPPIQLVREVVAAGQALRDSPTT